MALNGIFFADVLLRNYSVIHVCIVISLIEQ